MKKTPWLGRAFGAALLAGSMGACDFIKPTETNPNRVPEANIDQLFVGIQVNTFFFSEGQVSRILSMWMQQMAGTDRQFQAIDQYTFGEDVADGEWSTIYTGGGLLDIREGIRIAEEGGFRPYAGALKVQEAYLIGMSASIWGDIPYSQAANASEFPTPVLDDQAAVYAAVQTRLDEAIADLAQTGRFPGASIDFSFGGDKAKWAAAAHSLKARYYMHWVEAAGAGGTHPACARAGSGNNCLTNALAEAQLGISSAAGDWKTFHTSTATESNFWVQFLSERSGYISAGQFGVDALKSRNDPRLALYYSQDADGEYTGSPPGTNSSDPNTDASSLSEQGYGAVDFRIPMVSCAETQLIIAEVHFRQGNEPAARTALNAAIACEEARLGVDIATPDPALAGQALFDEIMLQKYLALFLNMEAYNDYKRTCRPVLIAANGVNPLQMPGRLFYGQGEAQTNPNVRAATQGERNDNDPAGCS